MKIHLQYFCCLIFPHLTSFFSSVLLSSRCRRSVTVNCVIGELGVSRHNMRASSEVPFDFVLLNNGAAHIPIMWSFFDSFYLFAYFFLNLLLTLFNKVFLGRVSGSRRRTWSTLLASLGCSTKLVSLIMCKCPYPSFLTASHATASFIGCQLLRSTGHFMPAPLQSDDCLKLVLLSALYTINIAMSNWSLCAVFQLHSVIRRTHIHAVSSLPPLSIKSFELLLRHSLSSYIVLVLAGNTERRHTYPLFP